MVQGRTRVYRDDWGFKIVATEEQFAYDKGFIKNDGFRIVDEYDYIGIEDYNLCLEVDEALFEWKYNLVALLADGVYLEYDVNNYIPLTFAKAIREEWYTGRELADVIDIIKGVKEGRYNDEMERYYAYIQAVEALKNIDLFNFNWEDEFILLDNLRINGIYIYDEGIIFKVSGVTESVDRTYGLGVDVKRLLLKVIRRLKNTGETIDFTKGY